MILVFRSVFALDDALEFHAFAPLEALPCVWPWHSSRVFTLLPVGTVNSVETLKATPTHAVIETQSLQVLYGVPNPNPNP
jgi:hypothetical protein